MIRFDRVPIIRGLKIYAEEKNARFHMPGHRNEEDLEELSFLKANLYRFDVTELSGTDNLHYPEEIIKASQKLLAEAMGSEESLYCINGSTSSNYAMMFGLLKRKDKVLVQRNCHQSIYNAMALLDLSPAFLMPDILETFELPSVVTLLELKRVYEQHPDCRAVILTSPTYHGTVADIRSLSDFCREKGLYLLVDEAHGAHFSFSKLLPQPSITLGAHASSVSFHKTLPSLTQGSVLNLSSLLTDKERLRIRHYHRVFQSSSPSYPMLCSMEMARYYMEEHGEVLYEKLINDVRVLKEALLEIPGISVMTKDHHEHSDETRLLIRTPLPGTMVDEILRRDHKIQCEMTEGRNLIFILTPLDHKDDLMKIASALRLMAESRKDHWLRADDQSLSSVRYDTEPVRRYAESEVLFMDDEEISLSDAEGRVSFEKITPYPPGIPLLLPGEIITGKHINMLGKLSDQGANVLKTHSEQKDTISVVK